MASRGEPITAPLLRQVLSYEPRTGTFWWRVSRGGKAIRSAAGFQSGRGYVNICVGGRHYRAHRLAWLYVTGRWPKEEIDHVNRNRAEQQVGAICGRQQAHKTVSTRHREAANRALGASGKISVLRNGTPVCRYRGRRYTSAALTI
jgi:HNH endonuclease